jgi:hypothetical protein
VKKKSENKNFVVCIRSMVRSGDVITGIPGVIKTSQQCEVSFPFASFVGILYVI